MPACRRPRCTEMLDAAVYQSALQSAGPQAAHIERLWWLQFWVAAAVFLLTMAFLACAVVLGRRRARLGSQRTTEIRLTPDPTTEIRVKTQNRGEGPLKPAPPGDLEDPQPHQAGLNVAVTLAVGATVVILFVLLVA